MIAQWVNPNITEEGHLVQAEVGVLGEMFREVEGICCLLLLSIPSLIPSAALSFICGPIHCLLIQAELELMTQAKGNSIFVCPTTLIGSEISM